MNEKLIVLIHHQTPFPDHHGAMTENRCSGVVDRPTLYHTDDSAKRRGQENRRMSYVGVDVVVVMSYREDKGLVLCRYQMPSSRDKGSVPGIDMLGMYFCPQN